MCPNMQHIQKYISPYVEYVDYACIVYTDGGVNAYNDFINSDSGDISVLSAMHVFVYNDGYIQ